MGERRTCTRVVGSFLLLESVWQAFADIDDLLVWTGCDDKLSFGTSCVTMVSHVMAPALAALIRLSHVTDKARDQITSMTDVIATCLKRKTTWISPFATPPRLLVGFPPYAESVERLDAFYANFPASSQPSPNFFADWLAAADERARRLSPDQEHVDVFPNGRRRGRRRHGRGARRRCSRSRSSRPEDRRRSTWAGLGHLIARRLAER
ncbi:hypothetical protein MRX96_023921 [Rhipicephalus microplus]